jgi:L,D-transpeptidase catalytic domain
MRRSAVIIATGLLVTVSATSAEARLDLYVDKTTQRIAVVQDGYMRYVWPVSTGRDGYATPNGTYAPERLEQSWFSKAYYDSPMPYSIFFHNGYAIHGSYDIARLGGPASHGCIRLYPQHAAILFGMVQQEGPANTTIVVGGGDGQPNPQAARHMDDQFRPADPGDGGFARGPYPMRPRTMPPYGPDYYMDSPGRPRSDSGQLVTRDDYRPLAPPRGMDPSGVPVGGLRGRLGQSIDDRASPSAIGRPPEGPNRQRADIGHLAARAGIPLPTPRGAINTSNDPATASGMHAGPGTPVADRANPSALARPEVGPSRPRGDNGQPVATGSNRSPAPDAGNSNEAAKGMRGGPDDPTSDRASSSTVGRPPEGPSRQGGDNGQLVVKGTNHPPAPRADIGDPTPPAKELHREPDQPKVDRAVPSVISKSPPEQSQPSLGYTILPKSYWTGASWRWRANFDQEPR